MLFTLQVREGSWADNDFRPTPIPLNEWHEVRDFRSYEDANGALPKATEAAMPARYWEDALRHSVYLTLVRDKIDELIAKGDFTAPDNKLTYAASENDDRDLWDKIKTAPFNRIENEDIVMQGDVTMMAKGRLMQENGRFRFTDDDVDRDTCTDDKCKKGIKAIWSVKRVRQREIETSPGKYHYELTFSVVSQLPTKKRKPQNLVRTFTVRESTPEIVVDMPQEDRKYVQTNHRPQRVVWLHRNISPPFTSFNEGRQHKNGLERLFSSLFSDEDDDYIPPRHRKLIPYNPSYGPQGPARSQPPHSPYSKAGYVGSPSDQQKRLTYPYKHNTYKYSRPIPPPPYAYGPKPHYLETESVGASFSNQHLTSPEHMHSPLGNPALTTKPAVLPTPIAPTNKTDEKEKSIQEATEKTTRVPEIVTGKPIVRSRPGPIKINYLPDHVRPPVYNAPPGIFVTMDKKPFKPMPPLKLKLKPYKISRPIDFRPSPQVLDMQQFSEPDPFKETAFRPITWNYKDTNNTTSTTENTEHTEQNTTSSTTVVTPTQKSNTKSKKPAKKHENIKSQLTTNTPDIITGNSNFEEEADPDIRWANLINAFSKTTPMASQKEKTETTESSTHNSSSTTETSTVTRRRISTSTEVDEVDEETTSTTTSTTVKPRKRTRPPPKYTKPDKVKKHKRITTTTTTQLPEKHKIALDLTPQASSAAATNPAKSTTEMATTVITSTTLKPTSTAYSITKTTSKPSSTETPTTEKIDVSSSTTQSKITNRFRQSTLLHKGTSVNHDKWSSSGISTKVPSTLPSVFPPRRKGSNFQSHVTPSSKLSDRKQNLLHEDKNISLSVQPLSTAAPHYEEQVSRSTSLQYKKEEVDENNEDGDAENVDDMDENEDDQNSEADDNEQKEFIFSHSLSSTRSDESSENNEIFEVDSYTTEQIITTQTSQKNLTKCQKKKLLDSSTTNLPTVLSPNVNNSNNNTVNETVLEDNHSQSGSTSGILEELIQSITGNDTPSAKVPRLADFDQQESENQSHFVKLDDDLQDFLDSLDNDRKVANHDEYEDDEIDSRLILEDDDKSPLDKWEHKGLPRQRHADADDDYRDRPYGLLELLAME